MISLTKHKPINSKFEKHIRIIFSTAVDLNQKTEWTVLLLQKDIQGMEEISEMKEQSHKSVSTL